MRSENRTIIIAEVGVNHNGDMQIAVELVKKAAQAGADYVKFQTFSSTKLAVRGVQKANYQKATTDAQESQLDMLRRLELRPEDHLTLMAACTQNGIRFLSSAFDLGSLLFLIEDCKVDTIKLGSGELTNAPILLAAAQSNVHIMLSTGMATLSEVEEALGVIAFGLTRSVAPKSRADCLAALTDPAAWEALRRRVSLLHCTTEYPAAVADTNLRALDTMRAAFGLSVGYSDHTQGNAMSFAAVARGATIIEKHFTLDRTMPGPDHAASIIPEELADLVRGIRAIELGLGTGIKIPGTAELNNRPIARKCVVAARDIAAGHVLALADLTTKRASGPVSPFEIWDLVGKRLTVSLAEDDVLRHEVTAWAN